MRLIDGLSPARYGQWAVVTGGNSGIGLALARILAAHRFNLVLTARRETELAEAAEEMRRAHEIKVETAVTDLSAPGGAEAVIAASEGKDIGIFIGNAGAVTPGWLDEVDLAELEKCVAVKIRSNLVLSHHFAGRMKAQKRGGILLVSSVGGRQGIPYLANNAAAEAYLLSLGEGLHHELKPLGINAMALLPGPTATPAFYRMTKNPDKRPKNPMTASDVAQEGLSALVRGEATWVAGRANRIMTRLMSRKAMTRLMGRMMLGMFGAKIPVPEAGR